jgi:hypothetical protein
VAAAADLTGSVLAFQQLEELPGDHLLHTPADVTSALASGRRREQARTSRLPKPIAPVVLVTFSGR